MTELSVEKSEKSIRFQSLDQSQDNDIEIPPILTRLNRLIKLSIPAISSFALMVL
jgi:hypothetical protein